MQGLKVRLINLFEKISLSKLADLLSPDPETEHLHSVLSDLLR